MRSGAVAAGMAMALLLPARAIAADLCSGPCSVSMEFPQGGSITAEAILTFGPEGGLLALGEGGSIDLGEGGSFTTLEGGLPNMSQGGTIVLGPGGSITFGSGGSLATGTYGGVSVPGGATFEVASARTVTIDSPQAVRLGDLRTHGAINVGTADGDILYEEAGNPFIFTMPADDTGSAFTVNAVGDVVLGKLLGAPNISMTAMNAHTISVWVEATLPSGEPIEPTLSCGGSSAATLYISTGAPPPADSYLCFTTIDVGAMPIIPSEFVSGVSPLSRNSGGAGGLGALTLLALGMAGLRRFRRS